jgi:hypothetical protein
MSIKVITYTTNCPITDSTSTTAIGTKTICATLGLGDHLHSELKDGIIGLLIVENVTVTLYDQDNFMGNKLIITNNGIQDFPNLGKIDNKGQLIIPDLNILLNGTSTWKNNIKSMRIVPINSIIFYTKSNFQGTSLTFTSSSRFNKSSMESLGLKPESIVSIMVNGNMQLMIFNDQNNSTTKQFQLITQSVNDISQLQYIGANKINWKNNINSVSISTQQNDPRYVTITATSSGKSLNLRVNTYDSISLASLGITGKEIDNITLQPNITVTLANADGVKNVIEGSNTITSKSLSSIMMPNGLPWHGNIVSIVVAPLTLELFGDSADINSINNYIIQIIFLIILMLIWYFNKQ